jgi:hypothetical protein
MAAVPHCHHGQLVMWQQCHVSSLAVSTPISPCKQWLAGWVVVLYHSKHWWLDVIVIKRKNLKNENENVILVEQM